MTRFQATKPDDHVTPDGLPAPAIVLALPAVAVGRGMGRALVLSRATKGARMDQAPTRPARMTPASPAASATHERRAPGGSAKTLGQFEFDFQPSIHKAVIADSTLRFVEEHRNALSLGSARGRGSHLAIALGIVRVPPLRAGLDRVDQGPGLPRLEARGSRTRRSRRPSSIGCLHHAAVANIKGSSCRMRAQRPLGPGGVAYARLTAVALHPSRRSCCTLVVAHQGPAIRRERGSGPVNSALMPESEDPGDMRQRQRGCSSAKTGSP